MNSQPYMPNPEVDKRLLGNLRHARLEMEEVGLQLEEVIAKLDDNLRQQRSFRVQRSLNRARTEG
ncbi:hypothetical protein Cri9333_0550 [Crinalium epipsammum PCC 9333]|uniref:Uncharacterized protein n=1 Tax=Crinalium epipsammum PCC 9333 TaxID=1173022 RepID=K9VWG6_9CYAN|nr:hypothetical protein [Crinalium epipsammum]AFZ11500.1 hypothetical protein Cri9333_0550 [Crinalium epipsammum PCC 9333]